jgi:hypothetical protein
MANSITERSRTLINNDLKKICKEEGTSQTGNKAALQARVVGRRCSRCRGCCLSSHTPTANFTLTSHHQCRHGEQCRRIAAPAAPRRPPRQRSGACTPQASPNPSPIYGPARRQRLHRDQRLPEQRRAFAVSAARNARPYAPLNPRHWPAQ